MDRSKAELTETAGVMRKLADGIYWAMFKAGIGWRAHPFMEFNGLISKYVDICNNCAAKGIPFPDANVHTGQPLPVEPHDLQYLAEKLACIFGPIINANPEARQVFALELLGIDLAAIERSRKPTPIHHKRVDGMEHQEPTTLERADRADRSGVITVKSEPPAGAARHMAPTD